MPAYSGTADLMKERTTSIAEVHLRIFKYSPYHYSVCFPAMGNSLHSFMYPVLYSVQLRQANTPNNIVLLGHTTGDWKCLKCLYIFCFKIYLPNLCFACWLEFVMDCGRFENQKFTLVMTASTLTFQIIQMSEVGHSGNLLADPEMPSVSCLLAPLLDCRRIIFTSFNVEVLLASACLAMVEE